MNIFNNLAEIKAKGSVPPNSIINAECLEAMAYIPDKSVDLILCDLPYGTTACKWDNIIPFEAMWEHIKRIRKDNSPTLLFGSEPFSSSLRFSNIEEYKYDWVWDKKRVSNPMMAKKMPLKNYELISVFYKQQPTYNPQPTKKSTVGVLSEKNKNKTHSTETTGSSKLTYCDNSNEYGYPKMLLSDIKVINNLSKDRSGLHPTQKPIELNEYFIKTYSNEGALVLDFTMGSGSCIVACKRLGRSYIGIEKELKYYEIVKNRLENEL